MTEKMELPPLPPPGVFDLSGKFGLGWTADQMRSYASEAVRMAVEAERRRCVQVCEDQSESVDLIPPDNLFQRGRMQGAWDCAATIRSPEA